MKDEEVTKVIDNLEYMQGKKDAMLGFPPSRFGGPYFDGYVEGQSVRQDR